MAVIYFMMALSFSLIGALVTPPFQVPDENEHYRYARAVSLGNFIPIDLLPRGVGAFLPKADIDFLGVFANVATHREVKVTNSTFAEAWNVAGDELKPVNFWGAAIYPAVAYAVPASGLAVADILHLDRLSAFYLGRIANAVFFALCTALAIAILPSGRMALAATLLLPMTLSQAGSFSADAFVLALSPLVCALLMRAAARSEPLGYRQLCAMAVAIVFIAATKLPMAALVLPFAAVAWRRSTMAAILLSSAVVVAIALWVVGFVMTPQMATRSTELLGPNVSAVGQLKHIASHPLFVIKVAIDTLSEKSRFYYHSFLGMFGWLEIYMPSWVYLVIAVLLAAAFAGNAVIEKSSLGPAFRSASGIAFLAATAMVFLSLYMAWTDIGASVVEGVQGRYFIPIMPLLVLSSAGLVSWRRSNIPAGISLILPGLTIWIIGFPAFVCAIIARYYVV